LPVLEKQKPGARDMTWWELEAEERVCISERDQVVGKIAELSVSYNGKVPPDASRHFENSLREAQQKVRSVETELNVRPALSFGCLFFVLVGCPVGIWFSRSDYLSAFITCFLPIVFLYYPLQLCSTNLAKDGKLQPTIALWLANAAMGLIALGLFRRLLKN